MFVPCDQFVEALRPFRAECRVERDRPVATQRPHFLVFPFRGFTGLLRGRLTEHDKERVSRIEIKFNLGASVFGDAPVGSRYRFARFRIPELGQLASNTEGHAFGSFGLRLVAHKIEISSIQGVMHIFHLLRQGTVRLDITQRLLEVVRVANLAGIPVRSDQLLQFGIIPIRVSKARRANGAGGKYGHPLLRQRAQLAGGFHAHQCCITERQHFIAAGQQLPLVASAQEALLIHRQVVQRSDLSSINLVPPNPFQIEIAAAGERTERAIFPVQCQDIGDVISRLQNMLAARNVLNPVFPFKEPGVVPVIMEAEFSVGHARLHPVAQPLVSRRVEHKTVNPLAKHPVAQRLHQIRVRSEIAIDARISLRAKHLFPAQPHTGADHLTRPGPAAGFLVWIPRIPEFGHRPIGQLSHARGIEGRRAIGLDRQPESIGMTLLGEIEEVVLVHQIGDRTA